METCHIGTYICGSGLRRRENQMGKRHGNWDCFTGALYGSLGWTQRASRDSIGM